MVKTEIKAEIRENEDRKSRSYNIVMFNLPESDSSDPEVRKEFDRSNVANLLTSLEIQETEIKAMFRLGKATKDKIRPLKLIFEDKKVKKQILDNAKNIPRVAPSDLKKVVISKDLTPTQREESRIKRARKTATAIDRARRLRGTQPNAKSADGTYAKCSYSNYVAYSV